MHELFFGSSCEYSINQEGEAVNCSQNSSFSRHAQPLEKSVPEPMDEEAAATDDGLAAIVEASHSKDSRERYRAIQEAQEYVQTHDGQLAEAAPALVDALQPALADANPKVVQGALELLFTLVERLEDGFAQYLGGVWAPLLERLGDAKSGVRERAVDLAVAASTLSVPAAEALDRLRPGFDHKNWRVRESTLLVLARTLAAHEVLRKVAETALQNGRGRRPSLLPSFL